jgi:hypothetical protein
VVLKRVRDAEVTGSNPIIAVLEVSGVGLGDLPKKCGQGLFGSEDPTAGPDVLQPDALS